MAKKKKKSVCDFVWEHPVTNVVVPVESPKQEFERKMQELRKWALNTCKETFIILIVYSIWAILFSYAYSVHGYSGLAISISIAIIYKLDRVNKK